jgi:hypothetical protein
MAVNYVMMLDWNLRNEDGVLVPSSVFEERLEKVVQELLTNAQKLQQKGPRLLWLSSLFVEIGNTYIQKDSKYKPKCPQFNEMMLNYFESASSVLETVGMNVEKEDDKFVILFKRGHPSYV